ncbi:hypothetical protein G6F64_015456 [Rhizopus arrhizus]|uniref:Uncharacterized protein n=1 Tax=Rhizopus oryzae TaxID=64495 RepID=A0A9P6WRE3_RHIOR|nr:hypothetical protein G6F64_015456 [Rhizopus arrhizus]
MKAQTSAAGNGTWKPPSIWLPRPAFLSAGAAAVGVGAALSALPAVAEAVASAGLAIVGVKPANATGFSATGAAPRPCAWAARNACTAASGCAFKSASTDITAATMPI